MKNSKHVHKTIQSVQPTQFSVLPESSEDPSVACLSEVPFRLTTVPPAVMWGSDDHFNLSEACFPLNH